MAIVQKFDLKLNIDKNTTSEKLIVTANDNVEIHIQLMKGRNVFELSEEYTYRLVSRPRGKNATIKDLSIVDGKIVAPLNHSETGYQLPVECTVQVFDSEGNRVTSTKFDVVVLQDFTTDGEVSPSGNATFTVVNEEEFKRVSALANEVEDAKGDSSTLSEKINSIDEQLTDVTQKKAEKEEVVTVNTRIDTLVLASGNANVEVTDSHVSGARNKTFTTLKNRLDELERDTNFLMTNSVLNGDFDTNTTSWYGGGSTLSVISGKMQCLGTGAADYSAGMQNTGITLKTGDKWFVKFIVEPTNILPTRFRIVARGTTQSIIKTIETGISLNTAQTITAIYTATDTSTLIFGVQAIYSSSTVATGSKYLVDKVVLINLTDTFGAGNEPTESEMNELLQKYNSGFFAGKVSASNPKKLFNDVEELKKSTDKIDTVESSFSNQIRRNQITTRTPFDFTVSSSFTSTKRLLWSITYDDEAKNIVDYGLPIHQSENVPATFYVIPNRIGTGQTFNYGVAMTWNELQTLVDAGWEIGHHTVDHLNTSYMNREQLIENIESGNQIFIKNGIYPRHFSHPGGSNNYNNSNVLKEYFDSASLTVAGDNTFDLNPWRLKRRSADSWYSAIYNALTQLATKSEGWLISYHHAIHPDGTVNGLSGAMTCWTPTQLQTAIRYAKSLGIEIVGMDEGLRTYAPYLYYFDEVHDPTFSVQRNGVIKNATPINS